MLELIVLSCLAVLVLTIPTPSDVHSPEDNQKFREFLEKSKTGDGYNLSDRTLRNPNGSAWENSGKFEGDIILTDRQIDALVNERAGQRSASILPNNKWPDNTVVYEFGDGEFDNEQQAAILRSMEEIEEKTCVRFRRKNDNDNEFIRITGKSDGCYAVVGYYKGGGAHTLNLARSKPGEGCLKSTIILHELLHNLGFFHMQSTHNRDDYVRILYENMSPGAELNFERYDANRVSNLRLPYEYTSIMHYFPTAFSRNGQPTIEALHEFKGTMGQQDYLTRNDWLRVNRLYDCPGAWNEDSEDDNSQQI